MYRYDNRVVITLDAGGTNLVFGAMQANKFIVEPITMPSNADDLDKCLATMVEGFQAVIDKLEAKPVAISFAFPGPADYPNGIIGGYLTGVLMLHINEGAYLYRIASSVTMNDVAGGFIKSLVFGLLVATVCCHQGYTTHMRRDSVGPEAVGNATTSAVVISCVLILVADYVLTSFLL